ncbi:acetyl-CoA carboxylase biotin carboxylase subunit [Oceanobacillus halophilus]|uniref:biotin carboxylase n=1 Tax=Oceanobacillus halophilus TaxID=930130 RepID=A0A495AC94_9BACI|nr:acetyl-CoA carboxylase biotin carboxylase subunit [Oceanobacillus halophilus]RKQ37586.1 acetyl-CoA carboxylase biotin carboxylase subunit [Oceanobacillus halophilus]
MIKKVLIANRGEIAARIIRTCQKIGIKTVAVYSEADKEAPFVKMADEYFLLGASPVNESYMNMQKIFLAAKETGADAIHPGYGFLSESETFAAACREKGLTFIGPKSEIIKLMGNKVEARKAMKEAGIPIIPGTENGITSVDEAVKFSDEIGYPVMLKASAGGGGIGMQVVHSKEELIKAFETASKRAYAFFGNGSMFVEKKVERAKHIEIQLLADNYGNVVHLFERDCSIQRRNQKVIEEAPCPFISEQTIKEMGEAAVKAAKKIGYTSAGTMEFLVDEDQNYYFLEMNTRIQVEHPVTEEITGQDIVEAQIQIANGEDLSIQQADIKKSGHAIEVRIYAEDPVTFYPSPGLIQSMKVPEGENVRNETTVKDNYQVTPFYDPMIAKLIVKGPTREDAISLLNQSLEAYKVVGIRTNIPMLLKIINTKAFQHGKITTAFVEEHYLSTINH